MSEKWCPEIIETADKAIRRVGIEVEFAGLSPEEMINCIRSLYGGHVVEKSAFEYRVEGTKFGDFILELDADYLKKLAISHDQREDASLLALDVITKLAEHLVPWEIVLPPLNVSDLHKTEALIECLRKRGALGTRHSMQYAFGLHINPELPDLGSQTILSYVQAYFCLYDWICHKENIDLTRKITPFIQHFNKAYVSLVVSPNYNPDLSQLIDDYLEYNPTRNRSLDLLPLFTHIDPERVRSVIDDHRIKSRPTFHYRLPNCDIDNPQWNIFYPWSLWLEVERLAMNKSVLKTLCAEYHQQLDKISHRFNKAWVTKINNLLENSTKS